MTWLRLHTDILSDPKLMRAARAGAKQLHLAPWLMAFAKQADDGGRLSIGNEAAEPPDIAATIPCVTARMVQQCQRELLAIGVLTEDDDGVLRFVRWEPRQSKPSNTPEGRRERMQRHREKAKKEGWASPNLTMAQRRRVLERDDHRCRACGATDRLEIDHVIPISQGGTSEDDNLQVLCNPCNRVKGAADDVIVHPSVCVTPPMSHPHGVTSRLNVTPPKPGNVTPPEETEERGYRLSPEETDGSEEIPELAASAADGAPTAQDLLERRERLRVGFRDLQAQEVP